MLSRGASGRVDSRVDVSHDERRIVLALRDGEAWAFTRVFRDRGPRIYSFLVRMCGRRDVAEDLYQETWVKLALHARRLDEATDLGAWLYTVARNLARSERRAERTTPTASTGEEGESAAPSPFDWASASETQTLLERALADLPLPFREVLLLVVVEGLDHDRVAVILGLSPEAVRQRLARARAKLTERVEAMQSRGSPRR